MGSTVQCIPSLSVCVEYIFFPVIWPLSVLDDLPPFLRGLLENLHSYSAWVEGQLSASYPLRFSHSISQNLEKHKALLEKQLEMADDQVDLYRVCSATVDMIVIAD